MRLRPKFGAYLRLWLGSWLLLTVTSQMPECYQRSVSITAESHGNVLGEFARFAATRSVAELVCGLFWASLSWLLQCGGINSLRRCSVAGVAVLVGVSEAVVLGIPLAMLNASLSNFSLVVEDTPPVTISALSITSESVGIILAFLLSSVIAGYVTGRAAEQSSQAAQTAV